MNQTPRPPKIGRGAATAAPRRVPDPPKRVLLVTVAHGPEPELVRRTLELATPEHAKITVLGVAKIYGTSLGLPHPGLQPNRIEWQIVRDGVEEAADELRAQGFEVRVGLTRARNVPKMVAKWVKARNFHAVVVSAPEKPRWRALVEGDLALEIQKRCAARVHAVPVASAPDRRARPA
jgi:K+-sensing histidine kinase KdpD